MENLHNQYFLLVCKSKKVWIITEINSVNSYYYIWEYLTALLFLLS